MEREKIWGMAGSALLTILLFLYLIFTFLTFSKPLEDLGGIPVMFGNVDDAFGLDEPPISEPVEKQSVPESKSTSKTDDAPIAQNSEPSIEVKEKPVKPKKEQTVNEAEKQKQKQEAEAAERKNRQDAQSRDINNQVSGLFGDKSGGSRGNTDGTGVQGVSTGNSTVGASTGIGGIGSFILGGRSLGPGGLVQPSYTVDDYGTVVVDITVAPTGEVISTKIGKGTNTPNDNLRNEALRAAHSTRFNVINSTNNQQGTITYRFNLK